MGGATIFCGDFEGEDKAGSPVCSVLDRAYTAAFGVKRRGRLARKLIRLFKRPIDADREKVELAILEIIYNEEGEFSIEVAIILLPHLRTYQLSLLQSCSVENNPDAIRNIMAQSTAAKYGKRFDPGWHLYCLHDLLIACEKSAASGQPVQVLW